MGDTCEAGGVSFVCFYVVHLVEIQGIPMGGLFLEGIGFGGGGHGGRGGAAHISQLHST